jgi:ABC-2 type transport system permease protein
MSVNSAVNTSSGPGDGSTPAISRIADLSYRNYDGEVRTRAVRWWVVALATIRGNITKGRSGYWIPAALILLVFIWRAILFYIIKNVQDNQAAMGQSTLPDVANPFAVEMYRSFAAINILIFAAALTVGSASIAADNRANALLVYLSKPLTRTDYLIGKWMGVFLPLVALSLIPSLLMYLFFAIVYWGDGFFKDNLLLLPKIVAGGILLPALHTSIILGISAYSRSARMTGAVYAAFYFITATLAGVVGNMMWFGDKKGEKAATSAVVQHLHVAGVAQGVNMTLFDIEPKDITPNMGQGRRRGRVRRDVELPEKMPERPSLPVMLLIGGTLLTLPVAAAYRKIRAVEVISG